VRALVHREDDRSRQLAAEGAEIVVGDLLDFHDVSSAMRGVSGAYFCYPIAPGLLDATVAFAQAATEAGIRSVVNMARWSLAIRPRMAAGRPLGSSGFTSRLPRAITADR